MTAQPLELNPISQALPGQFPWLLRPSATTEAMDRVVGRSVAPQILFYSSMSMRVQFSALSSVSGC